MEELVQAGATNFSTKDGQEGAVIEGIMMVGRCKGAVKEDMLNRMRDHAHKVILGISTTSMGVIQGAFIPPISDLDTRASIAIRRGCNIMVRTGTGSLIAFVGAKLV